MGKIIAAYGGGFKPPTGGHFEIVKNALNEFPEIDEFIIYVGSKVRDGIDQTESILVWDIYKQYLPNKVKITPAKSPIGDILRLAKDNPQDKIYFVIGYREGRDDDMKDVTSRTSNLEKKYPNIEVKVMPTFNTNMSGTNARKALDQSEEEFIKFLPDEVKEKSEIFSILRPSVNENLNENATYSQNIDYMQMISDLTNHMIAQGRNIEPLPELVIKNGDSENAKDFFGKTAYYDPNTQTIVLYTEGRHPKDIVRSYAHEMVHHTQYLEDRLPNVQTTDTTASKELDAIEREAYLNGNMIFRNWTDSIDGDVSSSINEKKDPKKGTGKKPEGSKRRLYTDEDPKDTVGIKFSTRQDIVDTLNKASFKAKSHARQSQIINLIHQRVRAAYGRAKDPDVKKRLKTGLGYITKKKEASKKKTQRLKNQKNENVAPNHNGKAAPYGSGYDKVKEDKDYFGLNQLMREIVEEPKYKIFSDMDGVLTDFDKSFEKYSEGIPPREYEKKFGKDKFWELIDGKGKVGFWAGMPWMEDGKQYWDYIKNYDPELLSSPSRSSTSRLGKRLWVKNNMPGVKLTLAQAYLKKNYAAPNHILIDDRKSNIDEWKAAGGIGILHTSAADTIRQLKDLGI